MDGKKSKLWIVGMVALGSVAVRLLINRKPTLKKYF